MRALRSLPALAPVLFLFASSSVQAQFPVPDCQAMAAWAKGFDRKARWTPNALGSRVSFYAHFMTPAAEALFGKPVLKWTPQDARSLDKPFLDCAQVVSRGGDKDLRASLQALRINVVNEIPNYLGELPKIRQAAGTASESLRSAPPSPPLLAYLSALQGVGRSQQAYNQANQRAGQVLASGQAARALLAALRDLPEAEIETVVAPLVARIEPMRDEVRKTVLADIAGAQASVPGLQMLDRIGQALRQQYAGVFDPPVMAELDKAILERRRAIGDSIAGDIVGQLSAVKVGMDGFEQIDRIASPGLPAGALNAQQSAKVEQAARAKRKEVADALFAETNRALAGMPRTDDSLDRIDTELLAAISAWPPSAAEHRPRFEEAARSRRGEIVSDLNRAEAGAMRGRVYEGGGTSFEFADRSRVFVKTATGEGAGTYTEEHGRVVVTVNGQSLALTREGRRLVGGPVLLKRTR